MPCELRVETVDGIQFTCVKPSSLTISKCDLNTTNSVLYESFGAAPLMVTVRNTVNILGVDVAAMTADEALSSIESYQQQSDTTLVAFANAHFINCAWRDADFGTLLSRHCLILNDGVGVDLAARVFGSRFPENLNGTDFSPKVLALAAARGWRVALVGSPPGVADAAAEVLTRTFPGLQIVCTAHGFLTDEESMSLADQLNQLDVDLLFVGMGCPRQERWASVYAPLAGVSVVFCVGAFFDFTVGSFPRAPEQLRQWRLEWLFRLGHEPRRLFRRYVVGNPVFLSRVLATRALPPAMRCRFTSPESTRFRVR